MHRLNELAAKITPAEVKEVGHELSDGDRPNPRNGGGGDRDVPGHDS